MDNYYTSEDMGNIFHIAPITLQRWRKQKLIPFVKVTPKTILYPQKDIDLIFKENLSKRDRD